MQIRTQTDKVIIKNIIMIIIIIIIIIVTSRCYAMDVFLLMS
jgi:hypothetical protein